MTDGSEGPPVCIFCGRSPTTVEDIFPRWLHRYLGRVPATTFESGLSVPTGRFQGLTLTATAKCVCQTCNSGWMSDLEDSASRILKRMFDERVTLSLGSVNLELVARWCMKTALMIQFIRDVRAVPDEVYADFYKTKTPPTGSIGFMARHVGRISNGCNSINYAINAERPAQGQLYGVTFFIKNVVVQIIGLEFERGLNIRLPGAFAAQVQPLWPERGSVIWPPRTSLDDDRVLAFARSLTEIGVG